VRTDVQRIRRRLLAVMLCDASACGVLTVVAVASRSRPSGPAFAAIASTAIASFVPGAVAVLREQRPPPSDTAGRARARSAVLLFCSGLMINTVGTARILRQEAREGRPSRTAIVVDVALLIAGDAIGVPYLSLLRALRRAERAASDG